MEHSLIGQIRSTATQSNLICAPLSMNDGTASAEQNGGSVRLALEGSVTQGEERAFLAIVGACRCRLAAVTRGAWGMRFGPRALPRGRHGIFCVCYLYDPALACAGCRSDARSARSGPGGAGGCEESRNTAH
jgi:hypothetical protein